MFFVYRVIKRILDFLLAVFLIIVLSPFILLLILCVALDSKGSVFFLQKRVGRRKVCFNIYKFRTMRSNTPKDVPTHLLVDADRYITRTGRFLRRTSLDELPQLFNILFGKMSFVGPRPALYNQDDLILERDLYGVNELVPGLTGWAQVNGRDELPIKEKARFDGEYAANFGFCMDMKCLLRTLKILKGSGVVEGAAGKTDEK